MVKEIKSKLDLIQTRAVIEEREIFDCYDTPFTLRVKSTREMTYGKGVEPAFTSDDGSSRYYWIEDVEYIRLSLANVATKLSLNKAVEIMVIARGKRGLQGG